MESELVLTGPDTPGGRFMRRFWHPIHFAVELAAGQALPVRLMSQDFTLYRGDDGVALAEVDPRRLALLADGLEVLGAADVEQARDDVRGDRLDLGVEVADGGVVVAPGRGDAVLGGGQLVLQGHEVLVGLEVGVGLGDGDEPPERLAEDVLALGLLPRGLPGRHRGRPRPDDVLEGAALVGGVPLDRLDEISDEVVPTGQLDVDLAPRLLDEVAQLDEAVVRADRPEDESDEQDDDDDEDDGAQGHEVLLPAGVLES